MTRKIAIAAIVALMLSILAGAVSPSLELWWVERNTPPGQRVAKELSEYCEAELYDRVLVRAQEEGAKAENAEYRPQILYVQWVANRRTGRLSEASGVQGEFMERYPDHRLAAYMHYAIATDLLASLEYEQASEKLAMIERRWPDAKVTKGAREIREKVESRKESGND